jgi:acetyl-CoA acetyltransferase
MAVESHQKAFKAQKAGLFKGISINNYRLNSSN